jgi:hypothetical protein
VSADQLRVHRAGWSLRERGISQESGVWELPQPGYSIDKAGTIFGESRGKV